MYPQISIDTQKDQLRRKILLSQPLELPVTLIFFPFAYFSTLLSCFIASKIHDNYYKPEEQGKVLQTARVSHEAPVCTSSPLTRRGSHPSSFSLLPSQAASKPAQPPGHCPDAGPARDAPSLAREGPGESWPPLSGISSAQEACG